MRPDGPANIYYYEGNQHVGTQRVYIPVLGGFWESCYSPNIAYFCPECGEIWARAVYQFEFDYLPQVKGTWCIETRHCTAHGDGQLLSRQPLTTADTALITREFHALLKGATA